MNTAQPQLSVLTREQILKLHAKTLDLLQTTGIRVDSEQALTIFADAEGASCKGDRVFLSAGLVERALASTPSSIEIFDRLGDFAFQLGGDEHSGTRFGIGVTNIAYQDPETDKVVPFQREHMGLATRLGHGLSEFDLISTPGVIQDLDLANAEAVGVLEMLANTTKPLVPLVSTSREFDKTIDMLTHLHGDISIKPFVIPYFNPITPLVLNEATSDKMITTIEAGLPFIYSSYGMSGASTPITAAGTLVMLNAELVAGLVFAQLIKAGTPVILGSLPAVFEMKTLISTYTSQTMLVNLACGEMMAHYGIPHCGTSGSGAGWGPDLLASGSLWQNHLTSILGKVGMAPFVGGNFDSLVFSPVMVIYANEVIRQARLFKVGIAMDEEAIGLDTIDAVGPGGDFFVSEQTLRHYEEVHDQNSRIWPGYSLDQWQESGSPQAIELLRAHSREVMDKLQAPDDHDKLLARGEAWLAQK